ncbi:MAG: transposase [Thermoplasmatales archaeon]
MEYRKLVGKIRKVRERYMDETTWRIDGKNTYLWVFVTEPESLYLMGSRSHEVPLKIIGKHEGIDMHDGFSAYTTLAKKTRNKQAWCWAHILKGAKELIQYNESDGRYIHTRLKRTFEMVKKMLKRPVESITESDMDNLDSEMRNIDVSYEYKKCAGFVRSILKRKRNDLFRFVINRDVESTNNRAERAIRPIVTYRKVLCGSRSDMGPTDFARVYSVLETKRKNGKFPFRANPD